MSKLILTLPDLLIFATIMFAAGCFTGAKFFRK